MSRMLHRFQFAVTTHDPQYWTPEHLAEAERAGDYDDWVLDKLDEVMREAGQRFIAANPDLFATDLT